MNYTYFKKLIWDTYAQHGRKDLPWRNTIDPYHIVVSEIMLQQTQVARVLQKYPIFLQHFPTFSSLAQSSISELLSVWQGMGYNRRALYLKKIAEIVTESYKGVVPRDPELLQTFPGIGKNTAGSILAFAFNKPTVFLETNIRRVYIHCFFADKDGIDDKQLLPIIEETLDHENPREWYYALMDYGVLLAKTAINPNRKSKHYTIQSKFVGSLRQVRGEILKSFIQHKSLTMKQLYYLPFEDKKIDQAIQSLQSEGFIREEKGVYNIA